MKKMFIGTWIGAPEQTHYGYDSIAQAGYTHVYVGPEWEVAESATLLKNALDNCATCGLKAIVTDGIGYHAPDGSDGFEYIERDSKKLTKGFPLDFASVVNHSVYGGFHAYDEPSAKMFDKIALWQQSYFDKVKDKYYLTVLLPNDANEAYYGVATYEEYIEQYANKVALRADKSVRVMSVDCYPMWQHGDYFYIDRYYLSCLQTLAVNAKRVDADIIFCVQTSDLTHSRRKVTASDVAFQYYTCLAFGVKGFQNFVYAIPPWEQKYNYAPINSSGEKTGLYYSLAIKNKQIQRLAGSYLQYTWKGIATALPHPNCKNASFDMLKNTYRMEDIDVVSDFICSTETLIGIFECMGKTALMITNFTDPHYKTDNKVSFNTNFSSLSVVYCGEKFDVKVNKKFEFIIESGEGVFVIFE